MADSEKKISSKKEEESTKQTTQSASTPPAENSSRSWFSENWKVTLGFILGIVLLFLGMVAVVQSTANNSYNAGYKAGVEYTITTYENTPWYSRWWSGITGTFPGKK